jgi:hypothetical protein
LAYNGTGSFDRLFSWATDKINNIRILASRMDSEMDGFATGLSTCVTKDGQTTTTERIPFAQGVGLSGASVVNPGGTFGLVPTGGSASRHLGDVLGEIVNPKAFGAVGDGSTDDTAALTAWAARLNSAGGFGYIPPGTYPCTAALTFNNRSIRIQGDGSGKTVLKFTSATPANKGVFYRPDSSGSVFCGFVIRDLSIQTTTNLGTAVGVILPDNGLFTDHSRILVSNINISSPDSGYFEYGVRLYNTTNATVEYVAYRGSSTAATAVSSYYGGTGFLVDSQTTSSSQSLGYSEENRIFCCSAIYCQYGVSVAAYAYATHVIAGSFQFCRRGVLAVALGVASPGRISVTDCEFNCIDSGVSLTGYNRSTVNGCRVQRPDTSALAAFAGTSWTGIVLSACSYCTITACVITAESGTAAAGTFYGIYLENSDRVVVNCNVILGAAANSIDFGVVLDATSDFCKVSHANSYTLVTTSISNSGASNETFNKPTVTGSRAGNAALASLLTQLATMGVVTDSTTA